MDRQVAQEARQTMGPRPARPRTHSGLRFARSRDDAVVAGVAGGLGARWGVEPVLVRIAFVVLSYTGGVGVFAYLAAWAVSLDPEDHEAPPAREPRAQQDVAFGLIVLGLVVVLRESVLWFGDAMGIPLVLAACGAAVLYVGTDAERRPGWAHGGRALPLRVGKPSLVRIAVGGTLVVGGLSVFLVSNEGLGGLGTISLAVGVTVAGLAVVFGPWVWSLVDQLASERRDRIRSEERAEMAAHLHDSVLQTLALIQRSSDDPRKTATLARRQERELRSWLYGAEAGSDGERLRPAVEAVAESIETGHDVAVEVVCVGDRALDERTRAVVGAVREAATNAARHSGEPVVSVFVECEPSRVTAFVKDRGKGFDPETVPADRRGIADSIRGRVERHGGGVEIRSAPGEGCEVEIRMPVEGS